MSTFLAPIDKGFAWNQVAARHLLNRAGFGVPLSKVDEMVSAGPTQCVGALVEYEHFDDNLEATDFVTSLAEYAEKRRALAGLTPEERQRANNEIQRQQRQEIEKLKGWWIGAMVNTTRPLQEKMALFWHGHFATSAQEIKQPIHNLQLNTVFRTHATGNFRELVFAVGKTPAMLEYLDNKSNRKGSPNENWARELMELFTMGIGNYTEADIKEAARAFSGFTERGGEFYFDEKNHDFGSKTFLGRTGEFDGKDVVDIIFEQPETARFISRKIWQYFAYENPSDELVTELAAVFRGANYELKPLLRAIFLSREFYSTRAMQGQIKSPAQYIVMLAGQLGYGVPRAELVSLAMRGLGQDLFYPPNVKGWPGNRAWINTNTLLLRYNIPAYILVGERPPQGRTLALDEVAPAREMAEGEDTPAARRARVAAKRTPRPADVIAHYRPLQGKTATQVVDSLAWTFLGRPITPTQRASVAQVLMGGPDTNAVLTAASYDNTRAASALHLLLSTPEYQLC